MIEWMFETMEWWNIGVMVHAEDRKNWNSSLFLVLCSWLFIPPDGNSLIREFITAVETAKDAESAKNYKEQILDHDYDQVKRNLGIYLTGMRVAEKGMIK